MGLLPASAKALLVHGEAIMTYMVELDFTTGAERYTSLPWNIDYDGHTWNGVGGIGKVGAIESNDDVRPKELTLEVHGLPVAELRAGTLKAPQYKNRDARWIFALIDKDAPDTVVHAKISHYKMDTLDYVATSAGGGARITLEHEVTAAARSSVQRYSHQSQQARFAGDKGFEYLAFLASGRSIRWGQAGTFFVD